MKKSKRLQPVLHLAAQRKKQAEQLLGQAQQQLAAEQAKLQQLENYALEYAQDMNTQAGRGVTIDVLLRLQQFMSRLELAIEQQKQQLVICEQRIVQAKSQWQMLHGRHQAMDTLIERTRQDEATLDDKRLQKEVDERSLSRRGSKDI